MRFEKLDRFVVFHDDKPGSLVTMRGPRGGMTPNGGDHSDAEHRYAWYFNYSGALNEGDQFIFNAERATDSEVTGEVQSGQIVIVSEAELRARPAAGIILPKPLTFWEGAQRPPSGARVMAIFAGVQTPGAGWATLSHASANNESAYMAHGMSYISSYLKSRGHEVWLLDTRGFRSWEHFADEVKRQQYDFAMLGPLSIEAFTGACIVRILKEAHPNRPVIFGGLHVSMTKDKVFPPDDLPKFYFYQEPPSRMREYLAMKGESAFEPSRWPKADYVVWNEGELATAAIVEGDDLAQSDYDYEVMPGGSKFLNGKIVPDLNKMPHMDRTLFNEEMEKQHPLLPELPTPFHTITFGRGCPYHCAYCSVGEQFASTKVRLIDPDYFMDALHEMKRSNGGRIGSLMIHDDILLFPSWLEKWNEKIKQQFGYIPYWCQMRADFIVNHPDTVRHMAEAGMTWVSVGYEVGHARGLSGIMNKELKVAGVADPVEINLKAAETLCSLGVNSFGNFMFGNPTETNEEMDATVRMIQKIRPQHHGFSTYADFPGTAMSRLIDAEGLRMEEWYTKSHYPWQYRIKGVDYAHVDHCIRIAAQTPREYLNPMKAGVRK